ncbi:MAG: siphovirus ReqiPepy6 Gp37-like family protein [Lachnospiraceae bacterium]|nr:siphovirus ReqiPepy6 Gp37-like family protein [Lachnospiraceae bacterium]
MEIYVLDRELHILGVFETYDAIIWTTKLHEPGTFKASFVFSEKMNKILQRGNLLYKTDECEAGIITRKYLSIKKTGEETILIQGYLATRYLHQRIIWDTMVLKGSPEDIMRKMVYEQVIAPSNAFRIIPNIELGNYHGYEGSIEKQITYDNLQTALTDVSQTSELGYRLRLDIAERKFFFEVYKGVDRTYTSAIPCVFTRDYGNVYTQEYSEDDTNYCNVCLVAGSGEDTERIKTVVGDDNSGVDRYEMYYNASGLSNKDVTEAEYIAQLKQKGNEKLSAFYIAKAFESKINQNKKLTYALGDYVTCTDKRWGVTVDTQIKGIEKSYSKNEQSVVVTFGDSIPSIVQIIKAKE